MGYPEEFDKALDLVREIMDFRDNPPIPEELGFQEGLDFLASVRCTRPEAQKDLLDFIKRACNKEPVGFGYDTAHPFASHITACEYCRTTTTFLTTAHDISGIIVLEAYKKLYGE